MKYMTLLAAALAVVAWISSSVEAAFVPSMVATSQTSAYLSSLSRLNVGVAPPPAKEEDAVGSGDSTPPQLPELGDDGIYHILNKEQHQ